MRKKSHISLAKYLVENIQIPEMMQYKRAFYIGNILPDCKPSFLVERHEFDGTFEQVKKRIQDLTEEIDFLRTKPRTYMVDLGEVIHYVADYFTFPHNKTYKGNIKDHCVYEEHLKKRLREYVKGKNAFTMDIEKTKFSDTASIFQFIEKAHHHYLSMDRSVEEDCTYIVWVCHQVVQAILYLIKKRVETAVETVIKTGVETVTV